MRKIAATYIFPLSRPPIKNGILVCENDGEIVEIIDRGINFREEAGLEFYSGILVPGFIHLICNLNKHNKILHRKMWAKGIAVAADLENLIYTIPHNNVCEILSLETRKGDFNMGEGFSNQTSIHELFLLQEGNRDLELNEILYLVSLSRAKMLGLDSKFGSFDATKKPGVNLISGIDFAHMKLTPRSKVKRLL